MLKRFFKEKNGSVVEYVLIMCLVSLLIVFFVPNLRMKAMSWFNSMIHHTEIGLSGDGEVPISTNPTSTPTATPAVSSAPTPIPSSSPIDFVLLSDSKTSANTMVPTVFKIDNLTGGSGSSFTYTWEMTGYASYTTASANTAKQFSTTGSKTISAKVCDLLFPSNCTTKSMSLNLVTLAPSLYTYVGNYAVYTIPYSGNYKLQTWGAQGGNGTLTWDSDNPAYDPNDRTKILTDEEGGNGAFAEGTTYLTAGTLLYVYVGGHPGTSFNAGYNGGGSSHQVVSPWTPAIVAFAGGGGGATDIRTGGTGLSSRIIVAGGGGGSNYDDPGLPGNDYFGVNSSLYEASNNPDGGFGGQTLYNNQGKGVGILQWLYAPSVNTDHAQTPVDTATHKDTVGTDGTKGVLGIGGNGGSNAHEFYENPGSWRYITATQGAGGGGGYYGGGGGSGGVDHWDANYNDEFFNFGGVGGGGSSYIAPTLDDNYSFSGDESMPAPLGGTQTGQSGNGYAKIILR
jgi:Flp pilus assembly pilin Flp